MGIIRNKIPWGLQQRGLKDSQRHAKKIREALKNNLHRIISEESIISTDGKRTTKVPIRYLDSYYFKHGQMRDGVRHGEGEVGDILRPRKDDRSDDDKAGEEVGQDIYEVDLTIEELTKMMLEDLELPFLENKDKTEIITRHIEYTDLRKKGPISNWAKRQTVLQNIRRKACSGEPPEFGQLTEDDMRFHTWDEKIQRHSNAVVYLMMDRSGSMDDHKRYLCKATFWWLCRFLETKYDNVEVVFIAHDYEAKFVPEKDFFTISNDGGTRCSSAYRLAWEDIQQKRPATVWNVYCFHFSDGDNIFDDNEECVRLVKEMLGRVNMFCYGEVAWENQNWKDSSGLITALDEIEHARMMTATLYDKDDVYPTLKQFLGMGMDDDDSEEGKEDTDEEPS